MLIEGLSLTVNRAMPYSCIILVMEQKSLIETAMKTTAMMKL
jgi:hypothetical protein